MINKSLKLMILPSFSLLLTACGGGGDSAPSTNPSINQSTTIAAQPRAVETINWQNARIIQADNPMENSVAIVGSELSINVSSQDISEGAHLQIYLNTDNKPETGYQFPNEAWEESGVDFLIEDGDLFQSTQSNSGWNWNVNVGAIDYTLEGDSASANIDLSLLGEMCNIIKVGVMTRDEFWDIATFSPASTQMQTFEVSYCNTDEVDTVKPEITLLGANPLHLTINQAFDDPGANASDNIDGDITSSIIANSTVNNTLAGNYQVTYSVTDNAGNSATIVRDVIVNQVAPPDGIVVDGNTSDWNNIPIFSSSDNATMKVSDDEEKLYILVTSNNLGDNIQVFMDTDQNIDTGLNLFTQGTGWLAGADYMIENNSLDKSKNNTLWSWDYGIAPIEYIETANTLEIAIKKSDFNFLDNEVPMSFISRTENWNVNYILPPQAIPVYIMQFDNEVNPIEANNDSVSTPNDTAKLVDVLANDSSSTNSILTVSIVSAPETGTAVVTENDKVRYTPDPSFTGTVSFTYQISDTNGNTDIAAINVIVTAPSNSAPVATNDTATTPQDTPINISATLNDTDADGDDLTISNVSNPANGIAVIANNKITYTPASGFSGTDTFSYTVSDGNNGFDNATITVTVEENAVPAPNANNDARTTSENQSIVINALDNDSGEAAGITLSITAVSNPSNGTASIVNNKVNYTPANNFVGTDTFTYTISNGVGGTDTATITITVTTIPNNTPIANNDSVTTVGINTKQISVLANDTDEDGDTLQVVGFTQPSNGSISLTTATSIINYTPNATFSGTDTFTYTISDGNDGTDIATVSVTVPPNNTPDAVEDNASVNFNQTVTVDVLSNDTDPDNDVLSVLSIVQPPVGVATLNANGSIFFDPQNNIGSISIGYTVTDGRGGTDFAILTVSSTDPNDGNFGWPVIADENVTTTSGTAVFVDVLANDSDPDGDVLILDQLSGAGNGTAIKINGGVRYTPNPGFVGTDFVYYGVHDGFGHNGFGTITITVVAPNTPQ